eukprot:tig00020903_g15093.t1
MAKKKGRKTEAAGADDEKDAYSDDAPEESEEEGKDGYKKGGYHPVNIGETYKNGRFLVVKKLGWGHFSTVWLCWDSKLKQYVALKIQKSASHYMEAAMDEIEILNQIAAKDLKNEKHVARLLDHFIHVGPHGRHMCMVFEVLGENLLSLIKKSDYRGLPLSLVKHIARHILIGLDYLHAQLQIIHTDLKPENVLCENLEMPRGPPHECFPDVLAKIGPKKAAAFMPPGVSLMASASSSSVDAPGVASSSSSSAAAAAAGHSSTHADAAAAAAAAGDADVDAPKLTKNQKKKMKKKLKRQVAKADDDDENDDDDDDGEAAGVPSGTPEEPRQSAASEGPEHLEKAMNDLSLNAPKSAPAQAAEGPGAEGPGAEGTSSAAPAVKTDGEAKTEEGVEAEGADSAQKAVNWDAFEKCSFKVVDLGNACWTHKHFTAEIQTRQYRCPEVILGANYDTSADMWSLACVVFELATGDLLFDPHSGDGYDRDEDHLAQFIELLGKMPKKVALGGKFSAEFFNRKGELKHIKQLKPWGIEDVLHEKYSFDRQTAEELGDFLRPMLDFLPEKRVTAAQAIQHPWLSSESPRQGIVIRRASMEEHGDPHDDDDDNSGDDAESEDMCSEEELLDEKRASSSAGSEGQLALGARRNSV